LKDEERAEIESRIQVDPNFAATYEEPLRTVLHWNHMHDLQHQKHTCKELFMTVPEVIYTRKNFFLLRELNRKLQHIKASGLFEFWDFRNVSKTKLNLKEEKSPKVLNLSHFEGCFEILIVGVFVSFVVFVHEIYF
jgi:hypothetical protein